MKTDSDIIQLDFLKSFLSNNDLMYRQCSYLVKNAETYVGKKECSSKLPREDFFGVKILF